MENKLDISALKKAAASFEKALAFAKNVESKSEEQCIDFEYDTARASLIQHFEFCYELCWKTMKRFIEMDIGAEADILTRKDLFRISAEKQLIADFECWVEFHRARNRTSHIYDENVADEVYQSAKTFADDLRVFIKTMEQRI
jgi:nucleotidyltransferase substrate binding protein (TIGR01987 family)